MTITEKIKLFFVQFFAFSFFCEAHATRSDGLIQSEAVALAAMLIPDIYSVNSRQELEAFIASYMQTHRTSLDRLGTEFSYRVRFSGPFSVFRNAFEYQNFFIHLKIRTQELGGRVIFPMEHYPSIRILDVLSDGGDFEKNDLFQFVSHFSQLRRLSLKIVSQEEDCAEPFLTAASAFCPYLEKIVIQNIWDLDAWPECFFPYLRRLSLYFHQDAEGIEDIQNINPENFPRLEELAIYYHDLSSVASLKNMQHLTALVLIGPPVFDEEPEIHLEEALPTLFNLRKLCIYRNKVSHLSAMGLQVGSRITDLRLSAASMTQDNQAFILESMTSLKRLSFSKEDYHVLSLQRSAGSFFQKLKQRNVLINWKSEL